MGVNKVILIGNLGKDPELRYAPSGQPVASFSMATTQRWKNKDGELQERTDWHNIVAWRRQAEICNQYLKKGSPVYVEGRIQTRSYDDKDGNKRYITEVIARSVIMLAKKDEEFPETPAGPAPEEAPAEEDDLPF